MAKKTKTRLAEPSGELVQAVTFSETDMCDLRDALRGRVAAERVPAVIDSLQECCELGGGLLRASREAESAPEIKAALDNITAHARGLSNAIQQAEAGTAGVLLTIAHTSFADWRAFDVLAEQLEILANVVASYRAGLPCSFEVKRTPVLQVGLLHQALERHRVNIAPSRASNGKFKKIAAVCLSKMGYSQCPDYPIAEYLKAKACAVS